MTEDGIVERSTRGSYGEFLVVPGTMLGEKYEIDEIIGEGGMGIIARAVNVDLQTTVAVKILQPKLLHDEVALARFLQEARGVSKLRSPHIVRMLDVYSHPPDPPFMVMELLSGEDLDTMVARRGKLPPPMVVELVIQACAGVGVAHAAGILHRDLKPANLFLAKNDDGTCILKVLDFGLMKAAPKGGSKLTHPNDVFGSPSFMSPEQIAGETVDERTDVWALGAILFELLTGTPAFGADTIPQTLVNVATLDPPLVSTLAADVPPELEAIVSRCLAKDRTARFRTVAELVKALSVLRTPVDLAALLSGAVLHRSAAAPGPRPTTQPELPVPVAAPLTASPAPRKITQPTDETIVPLHRRRSRKPGIVMLMVFGGVVGMIVGLVAYGSRADEPLPTSKNVPTSASVLAPVQPPAPAPSNAETAVGTSVSDLPAAPVVAPKTNVAPRATAARAPIAEPSATQAPAAAATPVATPTPTPQHPPTAAPSIDPYPEFGRRK